MSRSKKVLKSQSPIYWFTVFNTQFPREGGLLEARSLLELAERLPLPVLELTAVQLSRSEAFHLAQALWHGRPVILPKDTLCILPGRNPIEVFEQPLLARKVA